MTSDLVSGGAAAHVFVGDLEALEVEPEDAHHLFRVRRLRAGERVSAGDGAGRWRLCVVASRGGGLGLDAAGPVVAEPDPQPLLTVGFSLVKGGRMEWTVQKLTEAGVDRILPLTADRSLVRWSSDEAVRHTARLGRVAREAAMQCRRAWLPVVLEPSPVEEAVGRCSGAGSGGGVALADVAGEPPTLACPAILVGPEGGWSAREAELPAPRVALGEHVFRSDTAAVAAGVLLGGLRGQLVAELGKTAYSRTQRVSGG